VVNSCLVNGVFPAEDAVDVILFTDTFQPVVANVPFLHYPVYISAVLLNEATCCRLRPNARVHGQTQEAKASIVDLRQMPRPVYFLLKAKASFETRQARRPYISDVFPLPVSLDSHPHHAEAFVEQ